jgi:predicted dehydrogenase
VRAAAGRLAAGAWSSSLSATVLLGLLGCGPIARRHIVPAIGRLINARLTAAFDALPETRQSVARSAPGCRAFDSVDAMLAARVVDAVVVGGPIESRASLTVSALGAGLPVLVEPPIAASIEEAHWIAVAERTVRLPIMVGFERWWWEPAERLRRALAGAPEGELSVESVLATEASDADPFVALAAHLDLVRHVVDREIATVSGRRESPGVIQAQLTFHGGGVARCLATSAERPMERITVRWGKRTYEVRSGSRRIWPASGPLRRVMDLVDLAFAPGARDRVDRAYEGLIQAFVDWVQTRTYAGPGSSAGIAALLDIMALQRSLEEGGVEVMVPGTSGSQAEAG